jgi:hypothetical protein
MMVNDGYTMVHHGYITGWWFFATPLKHDGVKVSWDMLG